MKRYAFEYTDKKARRRGRLTAFLAALCVCAVAALALYALLPGEGFAQKVADEPYDEGAFAYTGTLRGGKFSGKGRIDFAEGGWYEGAFSNGRFDGRGVFACVDGWTFEGAFSEGRPLRGVFHTDGGDFEADPESGIYGLAGGWRYMGLLGAKGPYGQGEFTFADGAVYRGAFQGGMPGGGQGEYTEADGTLIYTGGWSNGLFDGEGEYHAPDGSFSYKGAFRGGRFDGKGALTKRDGAVLGGTWKAGWRIRAD